MAFLFTSKDCKTPLLRQALVVLALTSTLAASAFGAGNVKLTPSDKSPAEIEKYVEAAVSLLKQKGQEVAFKEIADPHGPWVHGDWYVYVCSMDGYVLAHINKNLVGRDMMGMRDVKGIPFFAISQKIALSEKGRGWLEFWWPKPGSKEPSKKLGFIIRVPGEQMWVGTGVYDMSAEDQKKIFGD